jgi:hypothetical protein
VFAALVLPLSACALPGASGGLRSGQLERLYFGRNIGDTAVVSDSAWAAFVRNVVTVEFPEGSTAWNAIGQWRSPSGEMVHEGSFVLELLASDSQDVDRRVQRVIDAYKRTFAQQAVLRVRTGVRFRY